jgi:8-oxo-dGTP diphosphatase
MIKIFPVNNKNNLSLGLKNNSSLDFLTKERVLTNRSSAPLIVSLRAFIRDRERLLIVKSQKKDLSEVWEVPGGEIRVGEEPQAALKQRLEEKLGIPPSSIAIHFPLLISSFFDTKERFVLLIGWHCTFLPNAKIVPTSQIEDWRWVSQEVLKDLPLGRLKELISSYYWQQAEALGIDPRTGLTESLINLKEDWPKR